jgi:site-specific DNA-methyltransferase (adenine-specific)
VSDIKVIQGDCIEVLATLPENSIDACVTDPPYGLGQVKDIAGLLTEWMEIGRAHV